MDEINLIATLLEQAPGTVLWAVAVVYLARRVNKLETKLDEQYSKSSENNDMLRQIDQQSR